jgi:T5orf172 domain
VFAPKSLRLSRLPSAPTVASQTASRFRKILKTLDFTSRTRQVLEERLVILESRSADPEAQVAEEKRARKATKEAEEHAIPGIYVYTLPHYLRYPYEPDTGHTLLKVGHSGSSVIQRFNAQKRETVLPEEPVLLRVYPTPDAASADVEGRFHALLDAADHLRREGRSVGREWFLTTTRFLDQIALTLGLDRREVYDPENAE